MSQISKAIPHPRPRTLLFGLHQSWAAFDRSQNTNAVLVIASLIAD